MEKIKLKSGDLENGTFEEWFAALSVYNPPTSKLGLMTL